jgi:Rps23 Pro-64 3,4-dihydroxylase Tpa1-like proline 4-hydroxylase
MIEYVDNFLEEHIAQLIDMQLREVSWKYDYDSVKGGSNKHWHIFLGHKVGELGDFVPIWNHISNNYDYEMERAYLNAHTHGIEPHIHRDDGDMTFIYYPRMDWRIDWGGGTAIYDNDLNGITHHINYKGNRLIKFPANLPHQAQPVSRECYQLRTCVVFKTKVK